MIWFTFPIIYELCFSIDISVKISRRWNNKRNDIDTIEIIEILEIVIDEKERVLPQSRFGYPIEDADPLMDRKEFLENMIIKPYKI